MTELGEAGAATLPVKLLCAIELRLSGPLMIPGVPEGTRVIYTALGGRFGGPELAGEILAQGGDWVMMRADGTLTLDARITLKTDDNALILVTTTGRATRDGNLWHIRSAQAFETGDKRYRWLNSKQGFGRGRKIGDTLELEVYEVL